MVDYGDEERSEKLATHALVFMLVAVNDSWKIPIAHFLKRIMHKVHEIKAKLDH